MKTALRWVLSIVGVLIAAVILGVIVPRPLLAPATGGETPATRILLLSSHIHTDIAVPVQAVAGEEFNFLRDAGLEIDSPDARWVLFGWGGKAFYMATPTLSDIQLGPVMKSLTLDHSVMHVDVLGPIDDTHPAVAGLNISEEGLRRLMRAIRDGFAEADGAPILIPDAGYGDSDAFFEANGYFNAIVGCNTWTAAVLREAGLRTGWWNPLPQTLAYSLALYN